MAYVQLIISSPSSFPRHVGGKARSVYGLRCLRHRAAVYCRSVAFRTRLSSSSDTNSEYYDGGLKFKASLQEKSTLLLEDLGGTKSRSLALKEATDTILF
ncbi:RUN/FYVE domain protein [Perilla frutescens var. frutescens]|nr:RUN/FYVE domain protein [Perilla frutescens var. frutescens]